MSEPTIAALLQRIEDLERERALPPRRRARPRLRSIVLAAIGLATLLLVPVGVFASHQFTDVSTSNTFHASIAKVKGAGITAGCSSTRYCPNTSVTRGQMAAFLARTAGRADSVWWTDMLLDAEPAVLGALTVKAAEGTGGTGLVTVVASVNVYTEDASGCPCTGVFWVESESGWGSWAQYATVLATNVDHEDGPFGLASTTISVAMPLESGVSEEVYIIGATQDGADLGTYGEMIANVGNFDGTGANVVIPDKEPAGAGSGGPGGSRSSR